MKPDSLMSRNCPSGVIPAHMNWKTLNNISDLNVLIEESFSLPQAIFKHSTRCYISKSVKQNFESTLNGSESAGFYCLDLLSYRNISDAVAKRFDIRHESPQLIVVKNGNVIYNESHDAIDAETLLKSL